MNTVSLSIFLATFVYLRYNTNNKSGTTVCSKGEEGSVEESGRFHMEIYNTVYEILSLIYSISIEELLIKK